jgi:hypothetical protein
VRSGCTASSATPSTSATSPRTTTRSTRSPSRRSRRRCRSPARSRPTPSSSTSARISAPASTRGSSACSRPSSGTIGRSVEELATIYERLDRHPRLGVCLDSCHLYVSGVDVTDRPTLDSLLDELDSAVGLDRLRALHVNDSAGPLGSNRDRHANIGDGILGEQLGVFLGHPKLQGLPAVLETDGREKKGPTADDIRITKEMHERATAGSSSRPGRSRKRASRR